MDLSWETLENMMVTFPYQRKDAKSKPAVLLSKKMKIKSSRKVIGTFSEISTLIRSFTQLIFNNILDYEDPYYKWLIEIRCYLRYMQMPSITESQVLYFPFP